MKQRLHHYLITCDKCGKQVMVIHTGDIRRPDDWVEVFKLGDPDDVEDFCPKCHPTEDS